METQEGRLQTNAESTRKKSSFFIEGSSWLMFSVAGQALNEVFNPLLLRLIANGLNLLKKSPDSLAIRGSVRASALFNYTQLLANAGKGIDGFVQMLLLVSSA